MSRLLLTPTETHGDAAPPEGAGHASSTGGGGARDMRAFLELAQRASRQPSPQTHLRLLLSSLIPAPVPTHRSANAEDIEEWRKVYEMVSDIYIDFLHRLLQELSDAMSFQVEYADLLNYAEADRSDLIGRLMAAEDAVSEPPRAA